jgi:sarcosine oxidase
VPQGSEVAVIGAGVVGLCTAYALAERGVRPAVYERGVPGNGQSAGESRLFRHAHDDRRLVELARRGRAVWREWGERLGAELVSADGVVALGAPVERRLRVLSEAGGIAVRRIGAHELRERMPLLAAYSGPAMIDEDGGAINTRTVIETLAGELGDSLVADEVLSIGATGAATVEVRTANRRVEHGRAVVCAGRETPRLARGAGLELPVRLGAHVRLTFAVRGLGPARVACLQDGSGQFGESGVYGAPLPGNRGYALGIAGSVDAREDGTLRDRAGLAALGDRASAYVRRALPGLEPEPVGFVHCWVTELPWGDDALAVWESDGILVVAGNNLFKHAPILGRVLAGAALGGALPGELRPEARLGAPSRRPG